MTGAVSSLLRKWLTERESVKKIQIKCRYPCVHSTKYYTLERSRVILASFGFGLVDFQMVGLGLIIKLYGG